MQITYTIIYTNSSESEKKRLRRSTGLTEKGGQFDELATFEAQKYVHIIWNFILYFQFLYYVTMFGPMLSFLMLLFGNKVHELCPS